MKHIAPVVLITACVLFQAACNKISDQFRRDASTAYELIQSAEAGNTVMKADVEKAMATAKADAQSDEERHAITAVETYLTAARYGGGSELEKRYVDVCRWEAAKLLDRPLPSLSRPAKMGDCSKLLMINTQRIIDDNDCNTSDAKLNALSAKLKTISTGNPGLWLSVNSQREAREKIVKANCKKYADSRVPTLP